MDITRIAAAAAELREAVGGDGADLRLASVDVRHQTVVLELSLESAGCADCVLPPEPLRAMAESALHRKAPGGYRVVVDDPRAEQAGDAATPVPADGWLTVVDPTAAAAVDDPSPGPDAGSLAGKRIGFRVDVLWRSWDWVVDEWTGPLRAAGAEVVTWRRAQGSDRAEGARQAEEFAAFLDGIDVAVSGLANCGSCTSWTIKDAVAALGTGLPTVAVSTAHFEQLAHTLAAHYGRSGLRLHVLPYPLDVRPEDEVRAIARDLLPGLLERLGVSTVAAVA
ncbi:hypothetical protein [Pseudonocardia sp. NPDC049154]|uniref:UGSC family (seleno)protein n=1 Tax=Pseudonocardia sp. NPDC049154 TaxID=3155501 RepID=UPI0033E27EED